MTRIGFAYNQKPDPIAAPAAELEIRRAAVAILRVLQQEAPGFFSDFEIYEAADRREAARVGYHKV